MGRTISAAIDDILTGLRMRRVWIALASEDIGDQHRRTALGPLWLLLNYLIYVGTFVLIFGLGSPEHNFPAYVAIGMLIWLFLQEVVILGVTLFNREENFIQGTTLPLSVYVFRLTMQSLIRTGYAALGCVAILFLTGTMPDASWLWSLLAIVQIILTIPALIIVCAVAGAFFPDLQFIVSNLMRVGMFLTPIFWVHAGDDIRGRLYHWNPFTHFIEIVRLPVTEGQVPVLSFAICLLIAAALWISAIFLLGKFRKQIVFVL
ncbi:ABC transporter permease [Mesorhizobium sp. RMAD-H1]|uniref:ABC transporter permease n=1 Tax=Mesorhizobium sp. RMAD-H1 TaxID=2587065 RepID=UPI001614F8B7|nr:ABC transporter permease [Mesorhizobium sp. RMAD-H1]MBB2971426.1 lipopolysaccharide transport system permease protein [Mesorhizobium sp. RMAD-H1]